LIVEVLGAVNLRIQKPAKAAAMVVHVDKVKRCMGDTPVSWMGTGERDTTLGALEDDRVLVPLFVEDPYVRTADIINDNDDGGVLSVMVRPKRNAPMPARYLSRIYAVSLTDKCWADVINISCYRSEKRFEKELLQMDKEEKRLAVFEASDQEHLMRQEGEDLESGGDSRDQDEYSDSRSAAVDEVIYHRLLDSLDVIQGERDRIREERNRNLEDLASIRGDLLDVVPETQEKCGRGRRGVSLEDGQVLSDSDDDGDGGSPFPRRGGVTRGWIWGRRTYRALRGG